MLKSPITLVLVSLTFFITLGLAISLQGVFGLNIVGTLTGPLNLGGFKITSVAAPTVAGDAATKGFLDSAVIGSKREVFTADGAFLVPDTITTVSVTIVGGGGGGGGGGISALVGGVGVAGGNSCFRDLCAVGGRGGGKVVSATGGAGGAPGGPGGTAGSAGSLGTASACKGSSKQGGSGGIGGVAALGSGLGGNGGTGGSQFVPDDDCDRYIGNPGGGGGGGSQVVSNATVSVSPNTRVNVVVGKGGVAGVGGLDDAIGVPPAQPGVDGLVIVKW